MYADFSDAVVRKNSLQSRERAYINWLKSHSYCGKLHPAHICKQQHLNRRIIRAPSGALDLESAAEGKLAFASGGLAENVLAVIAGNDGLSMTEDSAGTVATSALNVHEVAVGCLNETLELMGLSLVLVVGVQKISVHNNCGVN